MSRRPRASLPSRVVAFPKRNMFSGRYHLYPNHLKVFFELGHFHTNVVFVSSCPTITQLFCRWVVPEFAVVITSIRTQMYMYTVYVYVYIYISICIYIYMYIYACMYNIYMHVCIYILCMYVYIICMYVYIYTIPHFSSYW